MPEEKSPGSPGHTRDGERIRRRLLCSSAQTRSSARSRVERLKRSREEATISSYWAIRAGSVSHLPRPGRLQGLVAPDTPASIEVAMTSTPSCWD
jgi:hypothetical protein